MFSFAFTFVKDTVWGWVRWKWNLKVRDENKNFVLLISEFEMRLRILVSKSRSSRRERNFCSLNLRVRDENEIFFWTSQSSRRERDIFFQSLEVEREKMNLNLARSHEIERSRYALIPAYLYFAKHLFLLMIYIHPKLTKWWTIPIALQVTPICIRANMPLQRKAVFFPMISRALGLMSLLWHLLKRPLQAFSDHW